jgi:FAD/FMN-containing dehydrogenase
MRTRTPVHDPPALPPTALAELGEALAGDVVTPADEGYDDARRVWNAMVDRRPGAVAHCTGVDDVVEAVRWCRRHDVIASVRGGGHNVAGNAVCDGGLVIDLSRMREVEVDPVARTVRAQGGVVLGDLDAATSPHGLAVPVGIVSETGAAGLTLGGGVGWLQRRHGLTVDNLLAVELVTADGEVLRASATEEEELFWGVRGGGGNFGVVTAFEYRAHPVATVLGGALFFAADDPAGLLRRYRDLCEEAPEALTTDLLLMTAGPEPFLPEEVHGRLVGALVLCWSGELEEGEHVVRPLRNLGPLVADLVGPMPFAELQRMFDAGNPSGVRHYWKSAFVDELSDELVEALVEAARALPSPQSSMDLMLTGGAVARVDEDATPYSHRGARFLLNVSADWTDPASDADAVAWARRTWEAARPATSGAGYVNYVADEREAQTVYGERKYARLLELKRRMDPDNFFAHNQNVNPDGI